MCWVSWDKLTKAKGEGGLGFRDLQHFNDALLAKISWKILKNPECLLARVLLGKYCHKTQFLESKAPASASHGWRGILIGKELLKTQLGKVIGNGANTLIWSDPWISLTNPTTPIGPATEATINATVSQLISPRSKDWDSEKIQQILRGHLQQILEIKVSKLDAKDEYVWLPTNSGQYSAKSGYYESIVKDHDSTLQHDLFKGFKWNSLVWQLKTSPKIKFFIWKLLRGALPVGESLRSRNVNLDANCPFCGENESPMHLLFTCNFVKQVWNLAPFKVLIQLDHLTDLRSSFEGLHSSICLPPVGLGSGPLFPWILWTIWNERNHQLFDKRHASPIDTIAHAIHLAREWQSAQTVEDKPI